MSGGRPVQVRAEVLTLRPVGDYLSLTLVAPGVADDVRPGHFVALAVGGEQSSMLLRRSFSVYRATPGGRYGGTVEVVFAPHGAGTRWLAGVRPGDAVDVVGPLGRPFALPAASSGAASCLLVGGGYGAAPLVALAEQLRERRCRVDVVLGAASAGRLFGVTQVRRYASSVSVTTEDGSQGERGRVTDVLPDVMRRGGTQAVYACGPMGMLAAVTAAATRAGAVAQTAVEEAMACGIGVCMTCVLPVVGADGTTRMVRSCTEGPVFRGDRVRWADVGTVPEGTLGAPVAGGHR
ncbi:dihydroorotate dehydrogenase electron transfer subunit [Vallicoccus soli]|uniref:Dihydroorotate dehydrogenase electron transfer subunit n=1 Tax=Vallicoccus soli TaxID=2339232 RepID=A0A3A3YYB9_9ACTN|nr:dihydroorotate dehydrogenase electron transfer subunit [Vallicoccus soli]RJK96750.1 dihydroorotate dehydrogenase electron transfer subunit [Vallicoccus soli]